MIILWFFENWAPGLCGRWIFMSSTFQPVNSGASP